MINNKNEKENTKYLYRIIKNHDKNYFSVEYQEVSNISNIGGIIGEFLKNNFITGMLMNSRFSYQTWNKDMIILTSFDCSLEIQRPIYEYYKEEIDNILERNMMKSAEKYINDGETKIICNFSKRGCKYKLKDENNKENIIGLDELYLSYTQPSDIKLFSSILKNVISNDKPSYEFNENNDILLKAGKRQITINNKSYDLMINILRELNITNKNGISK